MTADELAVELDAIRASTRHLDPSDLVTMYAILHAEARLAEDRREKAEQDRLSGCEDG